MSNIAKTDPVLPCESNSLVVNTAYLRYAILANGALPRYQGWIIWRILCVLPRMYDFQFSQNGNNFSSVNNAGKYCILMCRWFTILSGLEQFWISVANSFAVERRRKCNFLILQWRVLSNNFKREWKQFSITLWFDRARSICIFIPFLYNADMYMCSLLIICNYYIFSLYF